MGRKVCTCGQLFERRLLWLQQKLVGSGVDVLPVPSQKGLQPSVVETAPAGHARPQRRDPFSDASRRRRSGFRSCISDEAHVSDCRGRGSGRRRYLRSGVSS
eukprot:5772902-Prymnesium_polylepis.1